MSRSLIIISGERNEAKPRGSVLPFRRWLSLDRPEIRAAALAASLSVVVAGLWLAQQTVHPGDPRSGVAIAQRETPSPGEPRSHVAPPEATPPAPVTGTPQAKTPVEREQASPEPAPAPPPEQIAEQNEPVPDIQTVQEFSLDLVGVRSSQETAVFELRPGTKQVKVQLLLDEEESFDSFTATVSRTDTGDEVAPDSLMPATIEGVPVVIVSLPADKLSSGRYRIMLRGVNAGGEPELLGAPVFEVRAMDR